MRLAAGVTLALATAVAGAHADGIITAAPSVTSLTGMRSWSAPASTRVVLDFSATVTPVVPDSGLGGEIMIALPGERLPRAAGVPAVLGVHDGLVDSVEVLSVPAGARVRIVFRDTVRFRVFSVPAEEDKPFRLVVDASRPGAAAAEEKRLAGIATAKKRDRIRIVTVDAGHGGDDVGARGPRGVLEKRVTLAVARALVDELNEIPGVRGVLTRDGDYFIPLRDRYRIAERMNADLFVSIHANSSRRRGRGSGTEVYFLSARGASDQATQDLADLENAADLVGGVPPQAEDDLVNILYDVKRTSAQQQSQLLAEALLDHLVTDHRLEQRGVKQAGFAVLKSVEFPSVLVETAFINNPVEAKLLADPKFQRQLGKQLAEGVKTFFSRAGIVLGSESSAGRPPQAAE